MDKPDLIIKIMSFNIRYGTAKDGPQSWSQRKKLVVERIRSFDPDLLGLQECRNDFQADYLRKNLADYELIGIERGGDGDWALEMTPLLIKRSSFKIREHGCFWLSKTPAVSGSIDWGCEIPRVVTWAILESTQCRSETIHFYNTHFDHASYPAQLESAKLLYNHLAKLGPQTPVILCGDFNIERDSAPYQTLLSTPTENSVGLHDTYRDMHSQMENSGSFHAFGELKELPAIDWIIASEQFLTIAAEIDDYKNGDLYPSDHYPINATVKY